MGEIPTPTLPHGTELAHPAVGLFCLHLWEEQLGQPCHEGEAREPVGDTESSSMFTLPLSVHAPSSCRQGDVAKEVSATQFRRTPRVGPSSQSRWLPFTSQAEPTPEPPVLWPQQLCLWPGRGCKSGQERLWEAELLPVICFQPGGRARLGSRKNICSAIRHRPCFSHTVTSLPPQSLCTCCLSPWTTYPPDFLLTCAPCSIRCHFLREAFLTTQATVTLVVPLLHRLFISLLTLPTICNAPVCLLTWSLSRSPREW